MTALTRDTCFSHTYQTEYLVCDDLIRQVYKARVFRSDIQAVAVVVGSAGIPVATFRQRHCSRPPDFNKFT
ncbi:hypothetical protein DV517_65080 [Streptomyces sp. S816]|nr:hypothetical protein DV517_65080 [Streptomyces sp. S816]